MRKEGEAAAATVKLELRAPRVNQLKFRGSKDTRRLVSVVPITCPSWGENARLASEMPAVRVEERQAPMDARAQEYRMEALANVKINSC